MEKKLRVLLICLTRRGGLLHFNNCLAESLCEVCDVGLIRALSAEHEELNSSIQTFTLDTGVGKKGTILKLFSPSVWSFISSTVKTFAPDIIHITSAQEWNPILGWYIRGILKKPLVYTVHDVVHHEGTPFYFRMTEAIFRHGVRNFVVLSEQGKNILCENNVDPQHVLVVPHGVYDFFTRYSSDEIRQKNEILFFGRIEEYKGLRVLLEAMPAVFAAHPDWTLHIAGGGDVSPYQALLNDERIHLTNRFVSDQEVSAFMQTASIVALPYLSASQSGVIPTAFAFSRAVIATTVGSIPETVHDQENGLLIPPNDSVALTVAINRLIEDSKLRERLGKNGLVFANENLSWNSIAKKHVKFYGRLLDELTSKE